MRAIRGIPSLAPGIAPAHPTLGLLLPSNPLHHLLMAGLERPVVATSGNLSDEPICTDEHEALERLGPLVDLLLVHNRPIARHADDSIAWLLDGEPRLLRRARGYAPAPVLLRTPAPLILGVGGHLKSSVALAVERQVFISQHIGDLDDPLARNAFHQVIDDLTRLYGAQPVVLAHDMHPDYYSTQVAQKFSQTATHAPTCSAIQHHHAHFAACLAEHQHTGQALGIIWDGTGYGLDGTIWGGEFLSGDCAHSQRMAYLRPFMLPGGEAAIREPWRVALALLYELEGDALWQRNDLAPVRKLSAAQRPLLATMLSRGVNSPRTSSAGRLFDGVAALLGLCQQASYEGEAAMLLEYHADPHETGSYPFTLDGPQLDWRPCVAAVREEQRRGIIPSLLSARFHNTMVAAMVALAQQSPHEAVALSGGCFQNRLLSTRASRCLRASGKRVLMHRLVPPNDGGISLGQVAAAAARREG
ncbi:MAG: carbamoyltransferase HypF [Candidatus Viridilinea halotolerans]|uniref:Carbamoyltransferase HypF n=1 Tax=Candidatus Viridilinea halotolerans TaxID=2491704 RepID=A0A426TW28_9CHLR|nr:MAG: carbamoyltransferase HypF [Candidatus Viridilinea halotolerans]